MGGVNKNIPANQLLGRYNASELVAMQEAIQDLTILAMENRFAKTKTESKTIFIDPMLYKIPVSIGDRSENVQDLPSALMGTHFEVEGEAKDEGEDGAKDKIIRLFMQWGAGLPAQHLDMDLSCHVSYENKTDICSYGRLTTTGCNHSGDIRRIPEKVGTAEYIDVNLGQLRKAKAKYVTFTCNAYSNGALTPNLVVGWMNSKYPMTISEKTGVAYDPSCVQHQVRITNTVTKGLVFGVLDVEAGEIIWLEMPFAGQVVQNLSFQTVKGLLAKLDSKLSIGNLLKVKANAQDLTILESVGETEADETYTMTWAQDIAAVTQLLVD